MSEDPTSVDGRRRRGAASREAALACAVRIALADGLEGISFGRVAAEARMPKSSLQVLFGDRERLQLRTLAVSTDAFAARVAATVARSEIAGSRPLLRLCEAWLDVVGSDACAGGCLLTASVAEYRGKQGALPAAIRAGQERWATALRAAAAAAVASGEIAAFADLDQLVFELQAFQATANVAASAGDWDSVNRARTAMRGRIQPKIN